MLIREICIGKRCHYYVNDTTTDTIQIECRPHYSFHKSNVSKQTIDCLVVLAIVFLQGVGHFKALEQFLVVKVNAFRLEHLLGMWQKDLWFAWQKFKIN